MVAVAVDASRVSVGSGVPGGSWTNAAGLVLAAPFAVETDPHAVLVVVGVTVG
jgi:hypothetical protein